MNKISKKLRNRLKKQKLKKDMESEKMALFEKRKEKVPVTAGSEEELNKEFEEWKRANKGVSQDDDFITDDDTVVVEAPLQSKTEVKRMGRPPMAKPVVKPSISQNEPVSEEEEVSIDVDTKAFVMAFNEEYGSIAERDSQFTVLFAIFCEQRKTNELLRTIAKYSMK